MKFTLDPCQHRSYEPYGNDPRDACVTCLNCYHRLRAWYDETSARLTMVDDYPPRICKHERKKPVSKSLNAKRDYTDAMCKDCGCVLRHPDGPGSWEEVLFYGLVIKEEESAWSSLFG